MQKHLLPICCERGSELTSDRPSQPLPQGLALHVLLAQSVVGKRLVPHGVAGVSQSLGAQLGGLSSVRRAGEEELLTLRQLRGRVLPPQPQRQSF